MRPLIRPANIRQGVGAQKLLPTLRKRKKNPMMLREISEAIRALVRNRKPYVARTGVGRWTIREYNSVLRHWTDSGQTFSSRRDAERRLKETRASLKKRVS
jgi:hypothetical protein